MHRFFLVVLVTGLLAACASDEPPVDLVGVPTQSPGALSGIVPAGCPGALLEGILVRDDEVGFVVQHEDPLLPAYVVVWPHGWVARDAGGVRQLLDGAGRIRAREGDRIWAGGGYYPPNDWFHPCGEIRFTPAG